MPTHRCCDWNQQERRGGGGWDAGKPWKVNQPPPLFPSGPAGFVLEQNELLTVAFWSCFSSVSTSKGKEHCAERSPLTGSFHSDSTTVHMNFFFFSLSLFLVFLSFWPLSPFFHHTVSLEWPNKPMQVLKNTWSPWQSFCMADCVVLQFSHTNVFNLKEIFQFT